MSGVFMSEVKVLTRTTNHFVLNIQALMLKNDLINKTFIAVTFCHMAYI